MVGIRDAIMMKAASGHNAGLTGAHL